MEMVTNGQYCRRRRPRPAERTSIRPLRSGPAAGIRFVRGPPDLLMSRTTTCGIRAGMAAHVQPGGRRRCRARSDAGDEAALARTTYAPQSHLSGRRTANDPRAPTAMIPVVAPSRLRQTGLGAARHRTGSRATTIHEPAPERPRCRLRLSGPSTRADPRLQLRGLWRLYGAHAPGVF
jgi:hypothetical protein